EGGALLTEAQYDLAGFLGRGGGGGETPPGPAHAERRGLGGPAPGQAATDRAVLILRSHGHGGGGLLGLLRLAGRKRLTDLAVVAVDRDRLQAELPLLHVQVGDVFHRRLFRQVDRLGDRTGQE